jgi:hypothetical protein
MGSFSAKNRRVRVGGVRLIMWTLHRHSTLRTLALTLVCACSSATEPEPVAQGKYLLFAFNGTPLPVPTIELPNSPHDPTPSGCWYTLTEGELTLAPASADFAYTPTYRHSCTGDILSALSVSGQFDQEGTALAFRTPSATGVDAFAGIVRGDTVVMHRAVGYVYTFIKQH